MVHYKYTKKDYYKKFLSISSDLRDLEEDLHAFDPTNNSEEQRRILRSIVCIFNNVEQYILDMCELYLVSNNLFSNEDISGIGLVSDMANNCKDIRIYEKLFINIVKLRNSATHVYYIDDYKQSIVNLLSNNLKDLNHGVKMLSDIICKPAASKEMSKALGNFNIKRR